MPCLSLIVVTLVLALITPHAHAEDDTLRVLVWNVLRGGNSVEDGPEKALSVIRDSDVDVVLLQESYDIEGPRPMLGAWLAEQLGWNQHQGDSAHLCVLTRHEIAETFFHDAWHGVGARLRDERGRELIAYSIWLDYRAYITWDLRDNPTITDEDLLKAETERSSRLAQAEGLLAHVQATIDANTDTPVLVGGDFNTPSHLDWTLDTARVYKHRRDLPLPVSLAFEHAGFADQFRAVHPNPVQYPGITWSPMYRTAGNADQGFERIDRLYLHVRNASRLSATHAAVLPQRWEDDAIPAAQREFPSDHGAVVIELQWQD